MVAIDAGVWINALVPSEPGHADSLAFISRLRLRPTLLVTLPTLVRAEVAGAISRITRNPAVAIRFADEVVRLPFVRLIPLSADLANVSASLAANQKLRGADAVYAAVALEHGCDLVSLDKEHLTRLAGVVRTLTPAAALAPLPPPPPPP